MRSRETQSRTALYHLEPQEFAGIFGGEGFVEVLGSGVGRIVPGTIDEEKVTPRRVAALRELERLRVTLPPEGVEGAMKRWFRHLLSTAATCYWTSREDGRLCSRSAEPRRSHPHARDREGGAPDVSLRVSEL